MLVVNYFIILKAIIICLHILMNQNTDKVVSTIAILYNKDVINDDQFFLLDDEDNK